MARPVGPLLELRSCVRFKTSLTTASWCGCRAIWGRVSASALTKSGLWTATTVLGMASGTWVCGQLADRIGRKPVFILFQAGALLMVVLYSRITEPNTLLWVGAIMGLFVNGTNGAIFALMSGSLSHCGSRHRAKRVMEPGSRSGRSRAARNRRSSREVLFSGCDRVPRIHLRAGHHRDSILDSRAQGKGARIAPSGPHRE